MLIVITGTRSSGKSTLEHYLTHNKSFVPVRMQPHVKQMLLEYVYITPLTLVTAQLDNMSNSQTPGLGIGSRDSKPPNPVFAMPGQVTLDGTSPPEAFNDSQRTDDSETTIQSSAQSPPFSTPAELLAYVTQHWRQNMVTVDIGNMATLGAFLKRPFVLHINVDAPVLVRFRRYQRQHGARSLEDFVQDHDESVFGTESVTWNNHAGLHHPCRLQIVNDFSSVSHFHSHLDHLNLLNSDRLRPGWDGYFMTLASLASLRSNCMKRRVGAILVREHRIVATGYNGTPRGILNCNEGGCGHCNDAGQSGRSPQECLCLHAEENALLEAGRERVGQRAVLYCNTCPCLKCTIKIVQTGVKEVVYNLSYKMDNASAQVFRDAGVHLRQYSP